MTHESTKLVKKEGTKLNKQLKQYVWNSPQKNMWENVGDISRICRIT